MATIGDLVVNFGANSRQFDRKSRAMKSSLQSLSSFALRVAGPVAAVFGTRESINAAREQIASERKLEAVIKSTGSAAGLTAKEIQDYASQLQKVTNFGDETTISAAAMLATFKQIKGETFTETLAIAQDMATVLGTDMKSAVIQIGKALNDPATQMSALSRSGITFTQQQKDTVRLLQEQGDLLGAQKIILKELQSEFGGAAQAAADPLTQAMNAVGDISETLGFMIGDFVTAATGAADFAAGIEHIGEGIKDLRPAVIGLGELFNDIGSSIWEMGQTIKDFTFAFHEFFSDVREFLGASDKIERLYNMITGKDARTGTQLDGQDGFGLGDIGKTLAAFAPETAKAFGDLAQTPINELLPQRPEQLAPDAMPEITPATVNPFVEMFRQAGQQQMMQGIFSTIQDGLTTLPDVAGSLIGMAGQTVAEALQLGQEEQQRQLSGALVNGSQEAYSAIVRATQSRAAEQAAQTTARNTGRQLDVLETIASGFDTFFGNVNIVGSFAQ